VLQKSDIVSHKMKYQTCMNSRTLKCIVYTLKVAFQIYLVYSKFIGNKMLILTLLWKSAFLGTIKLSVFLPVSETLFMKFSVYSPGKNRHLSQHLMSVITQTFFIAAVHRFSNQPWATSKFQVPEGWHAASPYWGSTSIRCYHKKFSHHGDVAPGICAPLLNFIFQ
jgi:hypothetical protein